MKEIRKAEIEIHSHCNRTCKWCPNSFIDRGFYEELPKELLEKFLSELKNGEFEDTSIHNTKIISIAGFCEPFYNADLLKNRINLINNYFTDIDISISTNGDFLTRKSLDGLAATQVNVMDYDGIGVQKAKERFKDIGIEFINVNREGVISGIYKRMNILYYCYWRKNNLLEDRGGLLKEDIPGLKFRNNRFYRTYPCYDPRDFISIDYNGNIKSCCHSRADVDIHNDMILGNIRHNTLKEIYYSPKSERLKKVLINADISNYPTPCKKCHKPIRDYMK